MIGVFCFQGQVIPEIMNLSIFNNWISMKHIFCKFLRVRLVRNLQNVKADGTKDVI